MPCLVVRSTGFAVVGVSVALALGSLGCDPSALETEAASMELVEAEDAPFTLSVPAVWPLTPGGRTTFMPFVHPYGFPEDVTLEVVVEPADLDIELFPNEVIAPSLGFLWFAMTDLCLAPLEEYKIQFIGTSASGDVATATVLVPPDVHLQAHFRPTTRRGNPTVTFLDQSVPRSGCGRVIPVVSWAWDFGDGTTSTERHPAHTYAANGSYLVTLVATDESGETDSFELTVPVR